MTVVESIKELIEAIKKKESTIKVKGKLGNFVIELEGKGPIAWAIGLGTISVAVIAALSIPTTGGVTIAPAAGLTAMTIPVATSVFSATTIATAVAISVAAGGTYILKEIRKYKATRISDNEIILIRK